MKSNLPVRAFQSGDLVTVMNQSYPYVFKVKGFSRDGKSALLVNFTSGSGGHKSKYLDDLVLINVKEAERLVRTHATNLQEGRFPKGGPAIALAKKFNLSKRLQELRAHALLKPAFVRIGHKFPTTSSQKFGKKLPRQPRQPKLELDRLVGRLIWAHGLTAFESSVQSFKSSIQDLLQA